MSNIHQTQSREHTWTVLVKPEVSYPEMDSSITHTHYRTVLICPDMFELLSAKLSNANKRSPRNSV